MAQLDATTKLSVIVPVGVRHADITELYMEYKQALTSAALPFECIFVLDGPRPEAASALQKLVAQGENVTMVGLARYFGEATALMAGFEQATGQIIVTLPAYHQIESTEIPKLIEALESSDLAIGHRHPRVGGPFERLRRNAFHGAVGWFTGLHLHDLGCSARAMRRQVLQEIALYGDQHRFIAVLADRQGFRIKEVEVRQSSKDRFKGTYQPKEYTQQLLDIFSVFFLVRFTKKPLRFFGMVGVTMFGIGIALLAYLVFDRLVLGEALADRPALLLTSLLVVLGLQLFALGLLGELIIFTHARQIKDYQVQDVIQFSGSADDGPLRASGARKIVSG